MRKTVFIFLLAASIAKVNAQINVFSNNCVGVGSLATSSASPLSINTTGVSNYSFSVSPLNSSIAGGLYILNNASYSTNFYGVNTAMRNTGTNAYLYAVYASALSNTAQSTGRSFAVMGVAGNNQNGYNFGIFGQLQGSNYGAAVYGQVGTGIVSLPSDAQYAGYFAGNVKITGSIWAASGTITGSDEKIKKEITALGADDKLFTLEPKQYKLKSLRELRAIAGGGVASDTAKATLDNIPDGEYINKTHFGFLAQDLQKVYPDLVYESSNGTLGVDYQGLIPIIIGQMKKMKEDMDQMRDEMIRKNTAINALENRILQLEKLATGK